MRVRDTSTPRGPSGVSAGKDRAAKTPTEGAEASSAPRDVATLAGIPEAELTPKVRAAIDRLLSDVSHLREELELAKRRIQHLEDLADQDVLLPVANRRAFVRELSRLMAFAERYGTQGSVLYFDINGMKEINDNLGHGAGDAALRHVAEVLVGNVRASDMVGRLGGDEFGVILSQSDQDAARVKAERLAQAILSRPLEWEGQRLDIEISFGTYSFAGGESVDDALAAADHAMYRHKKTRGGDS
ncbi:MAG: GGDEF domain-containing protein [Kiloniellales bacterium]|nr:GGDEF domain-containing protein [Kiloniellales bacterium]